jgi:acyl carrier protein
MQQTTDEIMQQVTDIFRRVLDDTSITLNESTSANDIESWDSLNHIRLVVATEKQFKVKFTSAEMRSWKTVGDMVKNIIAKLSQQEKQ